MGYKIEFNWWLKLKPRHGLPKKLEKGKEYEFKKPEERLYPIGIPIELHCYEHDNPLALAKVSEITVSKNKTCGKFKIEKILLEKKW